MNNSTALPNRGVMTIRKAELHCHLDGIVHPDRLANVPQEELSAYRSLFPVTDMRSWLTLMSEKEKLFSAYPNIELSCLALYIDELAACNVSYAEIMLTNVLLRHEEYDAVCTLLSQYARLRGRNGVDLNFLIVIGRTKDEAKITRQVERIIRLYRDGLISGMAVAGDEAASRIKEYTHLFRSLHEQGVPIEIHAGEWCGAESVRDAITFGFCRRIGHGLSAFEDKDLIDTILKKNIHIEFCPTSNMLLTAYKDMRMHPLSRARRYGISFSINTDDPGDFQTTMNNEFTIAARDIGFTEKDFDAVLENSLTAAFRRT